MVPARPVPWPLPRRCAQVALAVDVA